ncbi:hypothetical protein PS396_00955 [Limosilactobacillus pontis]|uniref:Uncharacterized protein n=1 Tax=Limosilactobacillus pontis TaxID=35787 RepID=A0ABU7SQP9_9LACO
MTNENEHVDEASCIRHALVSNCLEEAQLILIWQIIQDMVDCEKVSPIFRIVESSGFLVSL